MAPKRGWKIAYAVCEYCGHVLTDIRLDNPTKKNAMENFVTCTNCLKSGKGELGSDEELVLVTCPADRWPPSTPYWVRRKRTTDT